MLHGFSLSHRADQRVRRTHVGVGLGSTALQRTGSRVKKTKNKKNKNKVAPLYNKTKKAWIHPLASLWDTLFCLFISHRQPLSCIKKQPLVIRTRVRVMLVITKKKIPGWKVKNKDTYCTAEGTHRLQPW